MALWLNLTEELHSRLAGTESEAEQWQIACESSAVEFCDDNPRSHVIMEAVFYYIRFCLDSNYSYEQSKNLLEIMQTVFMKCIFNTSEATSDMAIAVFKEELKARLAIQTNNINKTMTSLFSIQQVRDITSFFSNNMVKNFVAYQYVCHENYEEKIDVRNISVATPLPPIPLSQGVENQNQ
jgi:hypothetical protein